MEAEENLALRYLASSLRESGRNPIIIGLDGPSSWRGAEDAILAASVPLIGLSLTFQSGLPEFAALVQRIRERGFGGHLAAGGQFATVAARRLLETLPELDSVVRGDGETAIVELAQALETGAGLGEIAGLTWRDGAGAPVENPPRPARPDLTGIPRPLRTPPFPRQMDLPLASMLGSRGCLQGCTYCSIQTFGRQRPGPRRRTRPVGDVVDEMTGLYREHGVRVFIFHDDNFLEVDAAGSLARALDLGKEMRRRRLDEASLVIKIRPDVVTRDLALALREAGVIRAYVGIESGNPVGLRMLGRGHTVAANHRALDAFEGAGVFACFNLLVFHPRTTLEGIARDVAFARAHPRSAFNLGRVEIYAGTPLHRFLSRRRRLLGPEFAPYYRIEDPRAETASRVFTAMFHRRAFHLEGLLNTASCLGYEPALLRHAVPEDRRSLLAADVEETLAAIHRDTCDRLEEVTRLVEEGTGGGKEFLDRVSASAWETAQEDAVLEERIKGCRAAMRVAVRETEAVS